jgi:GDP-mannose 6-dehydrogenase
MVALVETLIGKGLDVRVLDRNVALARLTGANRSYIEEQIPHIAALLCEDVQALARHAEVLVVSNTGEDAQRAIASLRSDQVLVDLTRGMARRLAKTHAA